MTRFQLCNVSLKDQAIVYSLTTETGNDLQSKCVYHCSSVDCTCFVPAAHQPGIPLEKKGTRKFSSIPRLASCFL